LPSLLIQLAHCDAKVGFRRRPAISVPDTPNLVFHPSYFTSAVWKWLAVQRSRSSLIPTSYGIDTDDFQCEHILSKVERFGRGEKVMPTKKKGKKKSSKKGGM